MTVTETVTDGELEQGLLEEIDFIGDCEIHGNVISDPPEYDENFLLHWPKLVYDGCSFPLHNNICHCGFYSVSIKHALNSRYIPKSMRPYTMMPEMTSFVYDPSTPLEGIGEDSFENEKASRRNNYRSKKHKNTLKMRPHAGELSEGDVEDHIDGLLSLFTKGFIAYKAQNSVSVAIIFLDFIREQVPNELYGHFAQFVLDWKDYLSSFTLEQIVAKVKECVSNWKLFENGELYPMMKDALNLMCILVLTPSEFVPAVLAKKDSFYKYLDSIRTNSTDVISWIMKTVAAVLESVKKYKETGNAVSAFCIVTPFQQMCSIYDSAMRVYTEIYNGLDSTTEVGPYFEKAVADLELLLPTLNMSGASRCAMYVSRLKACKQKLMIRVAGKEDNIQGFALTLTGSTGCGKTNLADAIMPYLLKVNGFPSSNRHIVTPNLSAKHWDNVSNDTFGMRFDDPDFLKPEFMDTTNHYITKIGRVLNNAAFFYEMADIEEKGVILCQVLVSILTSNSTEYGVEYLAREPSAIHRRIQYHVDMRVKEEYCKVNADGSPSTIIDSDKVVASFGDDLFPDIYIFNVYECQVLPSQTIKRKVSFDHPIGIHQEDKYCFAHSQWTRSDGTKIRMQDVSIVPFLEFLVERSASWFKSQKELLEKKKQLNDIPICENCQSPEEHCTCYEDALFGYSDEEESYGVAEEDYVPPEPEPDTDPFEPIQGENGLSELTHGRNPCENASSGPHRCSVCRRGYQAVGLWVYKDLSNESRALCRPCLATTRLTCHLCSNLTSTTVGMRRPPARILNASSYCKCGLESRSQPIGRIVPQTNTIVDNTPSTQPTWDWERNSPFVQSESSETESDGSFESSDIYTAETELETESENSEHTASTAENEDTPENFVRGILDDAVDAAIVESETSDGVEAAIASFERIEPMSSIRLGLSGHAYARVQNAVDLAQERQRRQEQMREERIRRMLRTDRGTDMEPQASVFTTEWITDIADRHMQVSSTSEQLSADLKGVIQSVMSSSATHVSDTASFLDGYVQLETAKFIRLLIKKIVRHAKSTGLTELGTWIPLEYEGTSVGAYLHSTTSNSCTLRRIDRGLCTFSSSLALLGYANFSPIAFYKTFMQFWMLKKRTFGLIEPHYPWRTDIFGFEIPRYKNVDVLCEVDEPLTDRIENTYMNMTALLKRPTSNFGFRNRWLMFLPLIGCFLTQGRPATSVIECFMNVGPAVTKKLLSNYQVLKEKLYAGCNSRNRNKVYLGLGSLLLFKVQGPMAAAGVAMATFALYPDSFLRKSHLFETGAVISRAHKLVKEDMTGTIPTFRDDVLGPLTVRAMCGRLMYILSDAVYSFRHKNGLTPQSSKVTIEDYSSLSGMSKHYYKKEWSNVNLDPIPVEKKSTPGELLNLVTKNLLSVVNFGDGTCCCAWALGPKTILLPRHFISTKRVTYEFKRKDDIAGVCGNAKTKVKFSAADVFNVAEDLCVVELPPLGDFADLSGHFANDLARIPRNGLMVTRDRSGTIVASNVDSIEQHSNVYSGLKRNGSLVTWNGLFYVSKGVGNYTCMSPILSVENPCTILGFHLGGNDMGTGASSLHSRDEIKSFRAVLNTRTSFVDTPQSGTLPMQMYGRHCLTQGIHPHAVAAVMDEGEYKLFGSTGEVIRDNSDVIDTPIADDLYDVFKLEDRWGPPNLKGTYSERGRKEKWLYTANQFTRSKDLIPVALLNEAVEDYLHGLDDHIKKHPPDLKRILTDKEVVSGIDGCDFVSPMVPNTSIGFPLNGPKSRYMESYDDDGVTRNKFSTNMFHDQAEKVREFYKNGIRTYPVSKTFVKNEPTLSKKEKCRLVNGAPVHFQFVIRKHALPLAKYICDYPDFFECAVGTVPYGRKWDHMFRRLMKQGNRIIAADYKGYDMNTGAQMVLSAFSILIVIAKKFGWHKDDIKILEGIAADVAWPMVDLNGDILMYFGGTISGHNLTSIINSIVNSLLLRIAFYSIYKGGMVFGRRRYFREVVTVYVYGDDLIGAVSIFALWYNNISIAKALGEYGLVMTPFDKKGSMRMYDDIWKVEFLKRGFKRSKMGVVGPLNELSILKRLASVHKPKSPNTMYTLLPDNLDGALIEWFYHGEKIYNSKRRILTEIVSRLDDQILVAACQRSLGVSYKARMRAWLDLYK